MKKATNWIFGARVFAALALSGVFMNSRQALADPSKDVVVRHWKSRIPWVKRLFGIAAGILALICGAIEPLRAQIFGQETIYVAAGGRLFEVDSTGHRRVLTDFTSNFALPGQPKPPKGGSPVGLAVAHDGNLLVTDGGAGTGKRGVLFVVDRHTGNRTILSDFGDHKQGPLGSAPTGVAVNASGRIFVMDGNANARGKKACGQLTFTEGCGALFAVDAAGRWTLVSDFGDASQGPAGLPFSQNLDSIGINPQWLTILGDGSIIVPNSMAAGLRAAVIKIDPNTGQRTLVTDFNDPIPTCFSPELEGVTVDLLGRILLTTGIESHECLSGSSQRGLYRIDPVTGAHNRISNYSTGVLPLPKTTTLAVVRGGINFADGTVLVTGAGLMPGVLFPFRRKVCSPSIRQPAGAAS